MPEIIHPVISSSSVVAYERTDNHYYWRITESIAPVLAEVPQGLPGFGSMSYLTPITAYNNWPESLNNASIFPYLLPANQDQPYAEFHQFVQTWYKTACAIIYRAESGETRIIGTGSLTDPNQVVTARHNVNNVLPESLFVRFYHYNVQRVPNHALYLEIREAYLDIPVAEYGYNTHGLDISLLTISSLQDQNLFFKYTKVLPTDSDLLTSEGLASGSYALFHFAGGMPQVSIGSVEPLSNNMMSLYDQIKIQAGPGASGATVINQRFNKVSGGGISIYRIIGNGEVARRILAFTELQQPRGMDDINAPYRTDPNVTIAPNPFDESGYEYIHWQHQGIRVPAPQSNSIDYGVRPHQSNHHIIPISDLLYLWDYLHNLDAETLRSLQAQVAQEANNYKSVLINEMNRDTRKYYPASTMDPIARLANHQQQQTEIANKVEKFKEDKLKALYHSEVKRRYAAFHMALGTLCQPNPYNPTSFAWGWWNLFKGWERTYRLDDPADQPVLRNNCLDFSEKQKPYTFKASFWQCLKAEGTGLYDQIQRLKATRAPQLQTEARVLQCLQQLATHCQRQVTPEIAPFNTNDWSEAGWKDDHPVYRLRN